MKILQICLRVPWPLTDGGNIAMYRLASMLDRNNNEVTVFALNTKKHRVAVDMLPTEWHQQFSLVTAEIDTSVRIKDAFMNLFRPQESYNVMRFLDPRAENRLKQLLQKQTFDIILLESIFTTPYLKTIRSFSYAPVLLRAHNVEHVIWKRLSEQETNPVKRPYLRLLAARLKKTEERCGKILDGFLPITAVDAAFFQTIAVDKPIHILPVSVDLKGLPLQSTENMPLRLFHLGSMDWLPNVEAVEWFLDRCWRPIQRDFPELELHLAGRSFPESLKRTDAPNVHYAGTVEDSLDYMRDKQIMVVPILSGSGMRVKILQGMALGKTIISTRIGCEGIPVTDGCDILLADTPEDFLRQVTMCMEQPEKARQIGRNARITVENNFSETALAPVLQHFLESIREKVSRPA